MLDRIRMSLKAKLFALFFGINMSAILLVGIISYNSTMAALTNQLDVNLHVMSRQTAENVDRYLSERLSDTRAIALHYSLFNLKTTTSNQNRVLARYLQIYPYYEHVSIINIEDMKLPDRAEAPWYMPAVQGKVVSSGMYISPVTEKPALSFAAPVKDGTGRVVSIITTNLKLDFLWDIVDKVGNENSRQGLSGYAFMVDRQGFMIGHPDRDKILSENPLYDPDPRLNKTIKDMTLGKSGTSRYTYGGIKKIVAYTPCTGFGDYDGNGWSVAVAYPTSELFSPLTHLVHKYLIIFFVTSALMLVISTQLAGYLVKPILALKKGAARVGGGDFNQRIETNSNDELGELAGSFNEMASTLQARDEQIREYTRTLTGINAELNAKQEELSRANEVLSNTNEELVKLQKQKAEFIAMLSHDIKSPLSTIITYTELLMSGAIPDSGDMLKKALNSIHSSGHKILSLVDNFLVSSSIDAGKLRMDMGEMDLNEFLEDELPFLTPRMEKKNITFRFVKTEGIPHVMADKVQLDRVVSNIVSNAISYTQPGGSITITTGYSNGRVFFEVNDTGTGISAEDQKELFVMFKRSSESAKVKGFGLGLFISKSIIDGHGGEITVDSKPGEGSTFTVYLPAK